MATPYLAGNMVYHNINKVLEVLNEQGMIAKKALPGWHNCPDYLPWYFAKLSLISIYLYDDHILKI